MALPRRLLNSARPVGLLDTAAVRALEERAASARPPHALMSRAGHGLARLARAVAPHARHAWIACGPGNNGGDGLVLAAVLQAAGLAVRATLVAPCAGRALPADAAWALDAARAAGVPLSAEMPSASEVAPCDLVVDALLGMGQTRAPAGAMSEAIHRMNGSGRLVLAVDVPTGLDCDTGAALGDAVVRASHTLALLAPKPGLFTGAGREMAGAIWFDGLDCERELDAAAAPSITLCSSQEACAVYAIRRHLGHKGSFGDVRIAGGAPGMAGAALLAAHAAAVAGAGRVLVHAHASDPGGLLPVDVGHPELMLRPFGELVPALRSDDRVTVVAGCGGGPEIAHALPGCLSNAARLVLDADALNALARDEALRSALRRRTARRLPVILTPHPLEAGRLLGIPAGEVQSDRVAAARRIAADTGAFVVLKGSGTVVAAPDGRASINPTGDARLATAGTGDVLAGWLGGTWSAFAARETDALEAAWQAAMAAVYVHGAACDHASGTRGPLVAGALVEAIARAVEALLG